MGGSWPYRCCFMECCFQDLFNIACSILLQFPSSICSIPFVCIHVVHPYCSIHITAAWKEFRFNLSERSDFNMIDSLSITINAFPRRTLISLSVDKTLPPRYVNLSINFLMKTHIHRFVHIHVEANAFCCLLCAIQQGFGLGKCTCKKCCAICVVCVRNSFCGISPESACNSER